MGSHVRQDAEIAEVATLLAAGLPRWENKWIPCRGVSYRVTE